MSGKKVGGKVIKSSLYQNQCYRVADYVPSSCFQIVFTNRTGQDEGFTQSSYPAISLPSDEDYKTIFS